MDTYLQHNINNNCLARCLSDPDHSLIGGILIEQSENVLFMPPGTLHCVDTESTGAFFLGADYDIIECLKVLPTYITAQLSILETSHGMLSQDIETYSRIIKSLLERRRKDSTIKAIESWLKVFPAIIETKKRLDRNSLDQLRGWIKGLVGSWKAWTKNTSYLEVCPCTSTCIKDVGKHFQECHFSPLE